MGQNRVRIVAKDESLLVYKLRIVLLILITLTGCTLSNRQTAVTVLPAPTETIVPTRSATATPTIVDGWQSIGPGLDWRIDRFDDRSSIEIAVLRIDPAFHIFRVHYQPGEALRLGDWQARLGGALALINTNFYEQDNRALGLVVTDGVAYGTTYRDRGGTFLVQNGVMDIRSNIYEPLDGMVIEQAVQAFPMLLLNGQQAYHTPGRSARRTAIGIDRQGRVLLIATVRGGTSLAGLSAFLATSDLGLVDALNLDGGGSTMIGVKSGDFSYTFSGFDPVPVVLAVVPRG